MVKEEKGHLKILPVKKRQESSKFDIDENLPQHPFTALLVAKPKQGKSNLLANIFARTDLYPKNYWDRVIIISPTASFDKTYEVILEKLGDKIMVIGDHDTLKNMPILMKAILDEQKEEPLRTLLIIDDCIGYIGRSPDSVAGVMTRYRHYNLTILVSTQSYRRIDPTIRNCCTCMIVFKQTSKREKDVIFDEVGEQFSDNFIKILDTITSEPFNFLTINLNEMKLYKNLGEEVIDISEYD